MFKRIVDEATLYGTRSFSLHLFGEPLLCSYILSAIRYLKAKRHTVVLTTNGVLLERFAAELMALHIDKVIWTQRPGVRFGDASKRLLKKVGLIRFLGQPTKEVLREWKGYRKEIKEIHNYGGSITSSIVPPARYPCYHLWLSPSIRFNGDFTLCCNDPFGNLVVGNIENATIHQLWRSVDLWRARKEQLMGDYNGICQKCNAWTTYPQIH